MSIKNHIISELSKYPCTTSELSELIQVSKIDINTVLYGDPNIFIPDNSVPIKWSLKKGKISIGNQKKKITTVVLVDLGNIHDCIKNLEPYAAADECIVMGFCDYAFAGYPVMEKGYNAKNIHVVKVNSPKKNAADTLLLWTCFRIISDIPDDNIVSREFLEKLHEEDLTFIVVTKDQGFLYVEDIVKSQGYKLFFCKGWNDLKFYL